MKYFKVQEITKIIREFKRALRNVEKAKKKHARYLNKVAKLQEAHFRSRDYKRLARCQALDEAVPDRRCPKCRRVKTRSRAWVFLNVRGTKKPVVLCKSCWSKENVDSRSSSK